MGTLRANISTWMLAVYAQSKLRAYAGFTLQYFILNDESLFKKELFQAKIITVTDFFQMHYYP